MSQSWDNVASTHDHLLTVNVHYAQTVSCPCKSCPLVPCACADRSGMNFEPVPIIAEATPLTAGSCSGSNQVCNGDVLALLECCYWTIDRYDKEQTSPLTSLEAWWLAPAPAQQAS